MVLYMIIQLCDKKKNNNMDKMQIDLPKNFNEIFGTQITFDLLCAVKSLKLKARSDLMYRENIKTIAIRIYRVLPYPVI